ncbi:hypothetical protein P9112_002186 [Eukaryota sp. TZLM1-RC]
MNLFLKCLFLLLLLACLSFVNSIALEQRMKLLKHKQVRYHLSLNREMFMFVVARSSSKQLLQRSPQSCKTLDLDYHTIQSF